MNHAGSIETVEDVSAWLLATRPANLFLVAQAPDGRAICTGWADGDTQFARTLLLGSHRLIDLVNVLDPGFEQTQGLLAPPRRRRRRKSV